MEELTHRARVIKALNHQEPDRVPLAAYSMTDVCYSNLRRYLGLPNMQLQYVVDRANGMSNLVAPHEDVLRFFDIDTRDVVLTSTTPRTAPEESDEYYEDEFDDYDNDFDEYDEDSDIDDEFHEEIEEEDEYDEDEYDDYEEDEYLDEEDDDDGDYDSGDDGCHDG